MDDPETEDDEPTIPLVAISAAIIKRHVALLLERLIQKAADSELFPHKPTAGTNSLRSQEKSDTAAAGSLIGLVHEILLGERWHPFSFQGTPGAHLLSLYIFSTLYSRGGERERHHSPHRSRGVVSLFIDISAHAQFIRPDSESHTSYMHMH